jgi:Icc-related predicted phosphoesterase
MPRTRLLGMEVLFVGDMHGDVGFARQAIRHAASVGIDRIVQVGDFGYWPHTQSGQRFLREVELAAESNGVTVWWIDGNHENHDMLSAQPRQSDGTVFISPHVRYVPRGHRWEWDGVRFGALGGAFSVDWRGRTAGLSWWATESPTETDLDALGAAPLDILVTHDCPAGIDLPSGWTLPALDQQRCDLVRALVLSAVTATEPALVVHGHWHHRHTATLTWTAVGDTGDVDAVPWRSCIVEGLAHEGFGPRSGFLRVDLATLAARRVRRPPDPVAQLESK